MTATPVAETPTKTETPAKAEPATKTATVKVERAEPQIVKAQALLDRVQEMTQAIARRAYELFELRGGREGYDLEDWLRASAELLRPLPIEIRDKDDQLEVVAEVPGFKAEEIEVSAEHSRLVLSGKTEKTAERKKGQTLYSERHAESFLRTFDLPAQVDPDRTRASLRDGMLTITLNKAEGRKPGPVQIPVEGA
jgi:HSP20 family protein